MVFAGAKDDRWKKNGGPERGLKAPLDLYLYIMSKEAEKKAMFQDLNGTLILFRSLPEQLTTDDFIIYSTLDQHLPEKRSETWQEKIFPTNVRS